MSLNLSLLNILILLLVIVNETFSDTVWKGLWFPSQPKTTVYSDSDSMNDRPDTFCDNAVNNIVDDLQENQYENSIYCTEKKIEHNKNENPLIKHNVVPESFRPSEVCMNETIAYDENIPTYGSSRPIWAKYGEYKFLPVQRWMHNLKNGAVVMLYHPCANKFLVNKTKKIVQKCMFRYLITPSIQLTKQRPLALVVWSKRIEFSVPDNNILTNFIKNSALLAPENNHRDGMYDEMLLSSATVVSDEKDSNLCPLV